MLNTLDVFKTESEICLGIAKATRRELLGDESIWFGKTRYKLLLDKDVGFDKSRVELRLDKSRVELRLDNVQTEVDPV